jgi:1-acyl-sn-glycerol-3-phosphate acyltransferase
MSAIIAHVRYWLIKHLLAIPLLHLFFTIEVHGRENLPRRGPGVIASNHLSTIDSVFVPLVIPRHVTYLAKSQFTTGRSLGAWFRRELMATLGQLAIDRSGGTASAAGIAAGAGVLKKGELLGIYPEGTRSPDGRLYRGRTGVARILVEANAPVVPVAVFGTPEIMPKGAKFPRLGRKVIVVFGPQLDFSRYAGIAEDRFVLRAITDEIVHAISKLSGQEYVDVYAGSAGRGARAEVAA